MDPKVIKRTNKNFKAIFFFLIENSNFLWGFKWNNWYYLILLWLLFIKHNFKSSFIVFLALMSPMADREGLAKKKQLGLFTYLIQCCYIRADIKISLYFIVNICHFKSQLMFNNFSNSLIFPFIFHTRKFKVRVYSKAK